MRHTGPHQWDYETLPGPHAVGKPRRISMIRVKALILRSDKWLWEIYAYEDKRLFSDTRRFDKPRAEVEKIVFDYLRGKDMGEQIEGFDEDDSWTKI